MPHRLGCYWSPAHNPAPELTFIHALNPPVIRILTEDVAHIVQAHEAAPDAVIIPRVWRLDDNRTEYNPGGVYTEMNEDPYNTGVIHASKIIGKVNQWRRQAVERGLNFPPRGQICVAGANEPNGSCSYDVIAEYAKGFARQVMLLKHRRCTLLLLGHGHPAGESPLIDWNAFMGLQPILDANPDFWVETHSYWHHEGPNHADDYPWHAGRHHSCPLRAPHLIGECGIDGTINNRNPRWGWINYGLTSYAYAQQLKTNHDKLADNVVAMLPFALGSQSRDWNGYDITKATNEILQLDLKNEEEDKPVTQKGIVTANVLNVRSGPSVSHAVVDQLYKGNKVEILFTQTVSGAKWYRIEESGIPQRWVHSGWIRIGDKPEVGPGPQPVDYFRKSIEFVLSWEGGYSDHPDDPGKATKYGISQNSYPDLDIENLTREDAIGIYKRDYWRMSGADTQPWPFCLMLMDTAVLHGKGSAQSWLNQFGPNLYAFAGRRLSFYVNSKNAPIFGAGWRNRLNDLLKVAAKP